METLRYMVDPEGAASDWDKLDAASYWGRVHPRAYELACRVLDPLVAWLRAPVKNTTLQDLLSGLVRECESMNYSSDLLDAVMRFVCDDALQTVLHCIKCMTEHASYLDALRRTDRVMATIWVNELLCGAAHAHGSRALFPQVSATVEMRCDVSAKRVYVFGGPCHDHCLRCTGVSPPFANVSRDARGNAYFDIDAKVAHCSFSIITNGMLDDVLRSNASAQLKLVCAGGSVINALSPGAGWANADVDVFLVHGDESQRPDKKLAAARIADAIDKILDNFRRTVDACNKSQTFAGLGAPSCGYVLLAGRDVVTLDLVIPTAFGSAMRYMKIQFITRAYRSVEELLLSFDLGSCCFAVDGAAMHATERGLYAIAHATNFFDPTKRSTAYRMEKYMHRGFQFLLPHHDMHALDAALGRIMRERVNDGFVVSNQRLDWTHEAKRRKSSWTLSFLLRRYAANFDKLTVLNYASTVYASTQLATDAEESYYACVSNAHYLWNDELRRQFSEAAGDEYAVWVGTLLPEQSSVDHDSEFRGPPTRDLASSMQPLMQRLCATLHDSAPHCATRAPHCEFYDFYDIADV